MRKSKLENLALKPFDDILKGAKGIAKAWDMKSINITALNEIINIAKAHAKKMKVDHKIVSSYLKLYNSLYAVCTQKAKEMGSKNVSLKYLESCIIVIKNSWKEGAKGNN